MNEELSNEATEQAFAEAAAGLRDMANRAVEAQSDDAPRDKAPPRMNNDELRGSALAELRGLNIDREKVFTSLEKIRAEFLAETKTGAAVLAELAEREKMLQALLAACDPVTAFSSGGVEKCTSRGGKNNSRRPANDVSDL